MHKVLSGIRVLEQGTFITGPAAGMFLADLGAEVIKLEQPGTGDPFRSFKGGLYSPHFQTYNRNKRSITLNPKLPQDAAVFDELVKDVDVYIQNFRPGAADRLGAGEARLRELNPRLHIIGHAENITPANVEHLVRQADIVVDAAPMFEERLLLNDTAMRLGRPMVECAMYGTQANVTTFIPGQTGCLRCYVPEVPPTWKRQFPVFGAVSGVAACIGAMEVIKLITHIGPPLAGQLLSLDLATNTTRKIKLPRRPDCPGCGSSRQT